MRLCPYRNGVQAVRNLPVIILKIGLLAAMAIIFMPGCSGSSGPASPSLDLTPSAEQSPDRGQTGDPVSSTSPWDVASANESVKLIVILNGAPDNLHAQVSESADWQYSEINDISGQVRQIYANNRGHEFSAGVMSQVGQLVARLETLRQDRAQYARSLLHGALDGIQNHAIEVIESIENTSVISSDLILNSLIVQTTREHVAEIESLPEVYEVAEDFEALPVLDTSTQSLKLRPGTYPDVVWDQGFHGENMDAMMIDFGMLASHSAFDGQEVISQYFPTNATGCSATGGYTHGTACASIVASQDATYTGTAYGLETFYNAKLCDGYDGFQSIQDAYDWACIGGSGYNDAEVVSMSVVFSAACSQNNGLHFVSSWVDGTVDVYGAMWSLGAGNRGVGCSGNYIFDKPQTCYNGVSVAAVNAGNDTGDRDDDGYATVSKYGPCDGPYSTEDRLKPEIVTPINVTAANGSGGWGNFGGTSCAAPQYAGLVDVLYSAGVATSLEMRSLTFATAEDYTGSPGSIGPDYYTGFGYADAWEAYAHIADTFTGSFTMDGETDFYRIENTEVDDRVVLVYDKHGNYPNWQISNLDIQFYDETTGVLLDETTNTYEPREYLQVYTGAEGHDVIVAITATDIASGVTTEGYAVSANTTMTEAVAPELSVSIDDPGTVNQFDIFEITADVENTGGVIAEAVTAEIDLPTDWQIVSGDNPQDLGDLDPAGIGTASWFVLPATDVSETISVEAETSFFGVSVIGDDDISIDPATTDILTAPASVDKYEIFAVEADYTNNSPGSFDDLSFELGFNTDQLQLLSGTNPTLIGTIAPGNAAHAEWTFIAIGANTVIELDVDFTYDGTDVSFEAGSAPLAVNQDVHLLTYPATVEETDLFDVEADYTNSGIENLVGFTFLLGFQSSKMSLQSGPNPAVKGDVAPTTTAHQTWGFSAESAGDANISLNVEFTYDGTPVSFTTPTEIIVIEEEYVDPNIPILICSGYDQSRELEVLREAGSVDFLHKPFDMDELLQHIRRMLLSVSPSLLCP